MSSASGSGPVYTIEARLSPEIAKLHPATVCGVLLDGEWRHIPIAQRTDGLGVPETSYLHVLAQQDGYMSRITATAAAWYLLAGAGMHAYGVEVRLVEHQFEYTCSFTRSGEGEPISAPFGRIAHADVSSPDKEKDK